MRVSGHCLDMTVAHQLSNPAMKMPIGLGRAMMDNKKTLCRLSCTMTLRGRWARFTRMREGREKKTCGSSLAAADGYIGRGWGNGPSLVGLEHSYLLNNKQDTFMSSETAVRIPTRNDRRLDQQVTWW